MRTTADRGRALFARRGFGAGELLFGCEPVASIQAPSSRVLACGACTVHTGSLGAQLRALCHGDDGPTAGEIDADLASLQLGGEASGLQLVECAGGCGLQFCSAQCAAACAWHDRLCAGAAAAQGAPAAAAARAALARFRAHALRTDHAFLLAARCLALDGVVGVPSGAQGRARLLEERAQAAAARTSRRQGLKRASPAGEAEEVEEAEEEAEEDGPLAAFRHTAPWWELSGAPADRPGLRAAAAKSHALLAAAMRAASAARSEAAAARGAKVRPRAARYRAAAEEGEAPAPPSLAAFERTLARIAQNAHSLERPSPLQDYLRVLLQLARSGQLPPLPAGRKSGGADGAPCRRALVHATAAAELRARRAAEQDDDGEGEAGGEEGGDGSADGTQSSGSGSGASGGSDGGESRSSGGSCGDREQLEPLAAQLAALTDLELLARAAEAAPSFEGSALFSGLHLLNHSCAPCASVEFEADTHRATVRALRPVRAGEELTISYCDESLPADERAAELREYCFECRCERCTRGGDAHDEDQPYD